MVRAVSGSWALVAGGSGGLGRAVCRHLAHDGWNVVVTYRHGLDAALESAALVEELGRRAIVVALGLLNAASAVEVVHSAAPEPLSCVVYAAGPHIAMRYISAVTPAQYREQLLGDAVAAYNLLHPAIAILRETDGSMVALVAPAVERYSKKDMLSSAPKASVAATVRGITAEEGRYGVRANCVGVGLVEGEGMWAELVARGDYTDELLATARRNLALRRFGSVDDIAAAVAFLASSCWLDHRTDD